MRALLLLPLLLLPACGGADEITGEVTESTDRLCVRTTVEDGTCFSAPQELLDAAQVGSCVTVAYEGAGNSTIARVTSVEDASSPCVSPP